MAHRSDELTADAVGAASGGSGKANGSATGAPARNLIPLPSCSIGPSSIARAAGERVSGWESRKRCQWTATSPSDRSDWGVSTIWPLMVSPARYIADDSAMSRWVSPEPATRSIGAGSSWTSPAPVTTVKLPQASTSRPARSIITRHDHCASTDEDPGAQLGTVNEAEPPVNSPIATGNSTVVTPTQSSGSLSPP